MPKTKIQAPYLILILKVIKVTSKTLSRNMCFQDEPKDLMVFRKSDIIENKCLNSLMLVLVLILFLRVKDYKKNIKITNFVCELELLVISNRF